MFFFFNDTATTEIYTLSLHDALPIYNALSRPWGRLLFPPRWFPPLRWRPRGDRKSTRLNSSHLVISYAVFCLKKKTNVRIISVCFSSRSFVYISALHTMVFVYSLSYS